MKTQVTFSGVPWGDAECFTWDDVKIGHHLTGEIGDMIPRVYPDEIMQRLGVKDGKRYKFTITAEEGA